MPNRKFLAALALAALAATGTVNAQSTSRSVWDGIYAADQAARGQAHYVQRCGACHGVTLTGTGEAPGLTGGEFVSHYDQLTVGDLFERVRTTMPMNAPGTMSRDEYAEIVAFLLKENGFPAGAKPLDRRSEVMATIGIQAQKPAAAGR